MQLHDSLVEDTFMFDNNMVHLMRKVKHKKFPTTKLIVLAAVIAIIGSVSYFGFASRTSILPVAGAKNFSMKISNTAQGVAFVGIGNVGKKSLAAGHNSPTIDVVKGDTVTVHLISEIHGEKYDFVIPDLNVHSKPIGYFEADTVTFVVDRVGEFVYTSSLHPEMKGMLVVIEG